MTQPPDHARVLSFYREFLAHGEDARKVAWRSVHDQELRFENLLEALDDDGDAPSSVLDVGCGLGDLVGYLARTGRRVSRYVGLDVVPEMVAQAQARWPQEAYPWASFEERDLLRAPFAPEERFDLVVCSGGLTVKEPQHERFVRQMLSAMLDAARGAVAVNFQSTRAYRVNPLARQDEDLYHADPLALYAVCRDLCRWTSLREDLLATDLTIYMYQDHSRSLSRYRRLPSPAPDPLGLAWLALERRLPREARACLADLPESPHRETLLGVASQQEGDLAGAAARYERALELDPGWEPARMNLEFMGRRR
jgi:SAM-dependent methyltransferase